MRDEEQRQRGYEPTASVPDESVSPYGDRVLGAAIHRRRIQRKAERQVAGASQIPKGSGAALDPTTQARMSPHLGEGVGRARIHTGQDSATAAAQLGARAFTVGSDIHFGAGEFRPGTKDGDRLLGHELSHVTDNATGEGDVDDGKVSRKRDANAPPTADDAAVSHPHDAQEKKADQKADKAADALHPTDEAKVPQVGKSGILTAAAEVKLDGKETKLDAGTVVEVKAVEGAKLKVEVHSGQHGVAEIDAKLFSEQPASVFG